MLGLTSLFQPQILSLSPPIPAAPHSNTLTFPSFFLKTQSQFPRTPSGFILFAQYGDNNLTKEEPKDAAGVRGEDQAKPNGSVNGGGNGEGDSKGERRPVFNLRWGDLLYPDTDNLLAVGLTGLLSWASVQVLWQLLLISLAILVAAVKYSFIAALLIFILITLL